MCNPKNLSKEIVFAKPLLLAIVTITNTVPDHFDFRIGVFLCSRKQDADYRVSLLFHHRSTTLQDASNAFGRLLQVALSFFKWRNEMAEDSDDNDAYEYLSSDCCRVKVNHGGKEMVRIWDAYLLFLVFETLLHTVLMLPAFLLYPHGRTQVLRSYDNRVRTTDRPSDVYLDSKNREIVGGQVDIVVPFPEIVGGAAQETVENLSADSDDATTDSFWNDSEKQTLQIIATPYRPGQHFTTSLRAFVPIIDQLQSLHANGYVHGDIRAFNTVFGKESNEQGCLIDFDFGGRKGERCFPKGYRGALEDGSRVGRDGEKILVWHDWYALGQLIFTIHRLKPPSGDGDGLLSYDSYEIIRFWSDLERAPTQEEIQELKTFLSLLEGKRWRVEPRLVFRRALAENAASG
jgi:hypothetical protein